MKFSRCLRGVTAALAGWLLVAPADAHDLWLVPATCAVTADGALPFQLQLGTSGLPEEIRAMEPDRVKRFELLGGAARPLPPAIDRIPLPPTGDGVVVLDRTTAHADLTPEKFTHYLEEERHADALARRKAQGAEATPGREDYTRHLKLLVGASGDAFGRIAGQDYEIVLLDDPRTLHAGDPLRARVLLHGKPIGGVRVQAFGGLPPYGELAPEGAIAAAEGRTNAQGMVSLPMPSNGPVLLRSVHLAPCTDCSTADWRSWWAAFTFCVGG